MADNEQKEVWIIQIPNPCNSADVAMEVYDDFDLFVKRSAEIRETWNVVAAGRSLLVNTRYY